MQRENLSIPSNCVVAAPFLREQPGQREQQLVISGMCRNPPLEIGDRARTLSGADVCEDAVLHGVARGDGKRTARDSVQDRVFAYVRAGQRPRAIADLERWVAAHPTDDQLLLSLARLLAEEGRSNDAIGRYRQILALHRRNQ